MTHFDLKNGFEKETLLRSPAYTFEDVLQARRAWSSRVVWSTAAWCRTERWCRTAVGVILLMLSEVAVMILYRWSYKTLHKICT